MARIVYDLPAEQYHPDASLSNSLLKSLGPTAVPVDFWRASWLNPNREEEQVDSKAKKFGRAAHMLNLEGEEMFKKHWQVKPGKNGEKSKSTTEEGKIAEEEYDVLMTTRDALLAHPIASIILKGCKSEVSMFADIEVEVDGETVMIPARCRHDIWKPQYSADLKFVEDVTTLDVGKSIANYGYDTQADFYPRIMAKCQPELEHQNFITIFVEKRTRGPAKVLPVAFSPTVLSVARSRTNDKLARYVRWMNQYGTENPWPSFENRIHTVWAPGEGDGRGVDLPQWWNYDKQ